MLVLCGTPPPPLAPKCRQPPLDLRIYAKPGGLREYLHSLARGWPRATSRVVFTADSIDFVLVHTQCSRCNQVVCTEADILMSGTTQKKLTADAKVQHVWI